MKRFCIINFTGLHKNWGCQATSWELLKFLNGAVGKEPLPHFSYVPVLPNCPMDEQANKLTSDIYDAIRAAANGTSQTAHSALDFLERACVHRYGFWAEQVRAADVIFFQAEGAMSGRTDFASGARLLLLPFVAKRLWGKRVISLNQSIFGTDPDLLEAMTLVYNSLDFTGVREVASFDFAQSIGITNVCYVPDAAFLTKPSFDPLLPDLGHKRYFCVTGTALKQEEQYEKIIEIADRVRQETELTPVIAASNDGPLERLAHALWGEGNYVSIPRSVYYPAVAHLLRKCEFLIGGRYHVAIMAAAVGTPPILLRGNTFKNEGLAAMLNWPYPVRAVTDTEGVLGDVWHLIDNLSEVRQRLAIAVEEIMVSMEHAKIQLAALLDDKSMDVPFLCAPRCAHVTRDAMDFYVAAATKNPRKRTRADCFGKPANLKEILAPLLAGLDGDPVATAAAIKQIFDALDHDPLQEREVRWSTQFKRHVRHHVRQFVSWSRYTHRHG